MSEAVEPFAIVLAGGSGTRFWPASRRLRPKQLLPLAAHDESLLEATVRRVRTHCSAGNVVISTNQHLLPPSRTLLSKWTDLTFLAEPLARNTAACIAWATWKISQRDPKALVMVLPSDHHIADEAAFHDAIRCALASAASGVITTLGIKPTRADTGFGYIELGAEQGRGVRRAARFVEKPKLEVAESYVQGGKHLWNSGMFFFRADILLSAVAEYMPELDAGLQQIAKTAKQGTAAEQAKTREVFETLPSISIDHGIMEKLHEVNVVPAAFGWSDVGSWAALWELGEKDANGNVPDPNATFIGAKRNYVGSFASKPRNVALVGVEDLCLIQTDDAILVVSRSASQDVRKVVEQLEADGASDLL